MTPAASAMTLKGPARESRKAASPWSHAQPGGAARHSKAAILASPGDGWKWAMYSPSAPHLWKSITGHCSSTAHPCTARSQVAAASPGGAWTSVPWRMPVPPQYFIPGHCSIAAPASRTATHLSSTAAQLLRPCCCIPASTSKSRSPSCHPACRRNEHRASEALGPIPLSMGDALPLAQTTDSSTSAFGTMQCSCGWWLAAALCTLDSGSTVPCLTPAPTL